MAVDLGDVYRCTFANKNPSGTLVNADTVTLTITLPDDTTTVVTPVTPTSTGNYQYDYTTVQAGRHRARWVGVGANPGAHVEVFDVRPAEVPYIVSLADAKEQLNGASSASDEELRFFLEGTTGAVEGHLGQAVVRRNFTEEVAVTGGRAVLTWSPVVALISATTVDGVVLDVDDLNLSPSGVVSGIGIRSRVVFVYKAGMAIVPANVGLAARIILQHLWETQRGSSGGARPGGLGDSMQLGQGHFGYALPNRAIELLGAGLPGIA
ncbi:hypothetical protein [Amycolatopsis thermoflava]|uniref:hypothetical protein n=1 Tax=Amycolatopsis thermoflava TaxID=84480 RepID=UPI00040D7AD2|nr:hypothetical protein [Amycolatopsis thermoflava]